MPEAAAIVGTSQTEMRKLLIEAERVAGPPGEHAGAGIYPRHDLCVSRSIRLEFLVLPCSHYSCVMVSSGQTRQFSAFGSGETSRALQFQQSPDRLDDLVR